MLPILSIALFLLVGSTMQDIVIDPTRPTVQLQCGVRSDEGVSRTDAACIALRIGLGKDQWRVSRSGEGDRWLWHVTPIASGNRASKIRSQLAAIAPVGGEVIGLIPATLAADVPEAEIVRLAPKSLPTIQDQCEIAAAVEVSSEQAKCIAQIVGAPDGLEVREGNGDLWVTSLIRPGDEDECGTEFYRVAVGREKGEVLWVLHWYSWCSGKGIKPPN